MSVKSPPTIMDSYYPDSTPPQSPVVNQCTLCNTPLTNTDTQTILISMTKKTHTYATDHILHQACLITYVKGIFIESIKNGNWTGLSLDIPYPTSICQVEDHFQSTDWQIWDLEQKKAKNILAFPGSNCWSLVTTFLFFAKNIHHIALIFFWGLASILMNALGSDLSIKHTCNDSLVFHFIPLLLKWHGYEKV